MKILMNHNVSWRNEKKNNFHRYCAYVELLHIGLDKGGYPVNIFLISPRKHMLWVLIRSASWRNKKNINIFGLEKSTLTN